MVLVAWLAITHDLVIVSYGVSVACAGVAVIAMGFLVWGQQMLATIRTQERVLADVARLSGHASKARLAFAIVGAGIGARRGRTASAARKEF